MKRKRISRKIIALIGFMEIAAMLILYFVANFHITKILKTKAIHDMNVIARDRAHLVEMYINECCHFLDNYSKSYEVRELLKHDTDAESISAADRLTRRYAESRDDLEGLYTAKWDTDVLVHTNPKSAGQTFRDAKSAKTLESTIKKHDRAFCTGIVLAPVTKIMVIPVYAPVYDEKKNAIGFIGAAFYTDFLKNALNKLTDSNMQGAGYALINADTDTYIFNSDSGQIGKKCTDSALLKSMKTLTSSGYRGENIHYTYKNHVIVCHNIKEWNWVFVLKDSSSDVYRTIARVRIHLIIVCLLILACMLTVLTFSVDHQMRPVKAIKAQIDSLTVGDYSHKHNIERYCSRDDELGTIANAINDLHVTLENQYELFVEMIDAEAVGTLITDAEDNEIILINAMAMKLYGFDPKKKNSITMDDIRERFDAEETEKIKNIREETKDSKEELIYETSLTREDGTQNRSLSKRESKRHVLPV